MKFSKIIGKIDPGLVAKAEEKMSKVFLELGVRYNNGHVGTGLGGDPFIFSLIYPVEHVCTLNLPTAGTDGKRYYWNPKFILKKSLKGLRFVCSHEAFHAIYMHPSRRGSRNPKLWNIAVDYIVNGTVMQDITSRKKNASAEFTKELGRYMTLPNFMELIKNPNAKIPGFEDLNPTVADPNAPSEGMPGPSEDRELTPKERKELEKRESGVRFFYADPDLEEDIKKPEKIYDLLYSLLPKCKTCGRVGVYPKPNKKDKGDNKKDKSDDKSDGQDQSGDGQDQHDHGDEGDDCDCSDKGKGSCKPGGCPECGGGVDIFGLGGTLDDHMDSEESEENMARRISDAAEAARNMAGHIPAGLEDEIGKLTAPKITWQDIIRTRLLKARTGNGKNDWTRFKSRPMFSGLLVPKRKSYFATFGVLLDTSGSMSKDDMAFGLSQLCSLDDRSEGTITCGDAEIYWDKSVKLKKANAEEISKVKVVGRGGTMFANYFTDYEEHIGKCDFLIIITDGFLLDTDIANMKNPGIDVIWLITSGSSFKAPFGRCFDLRS